MVRRRVPPCNGRGGQLPGGAGVRRRRAERAVPAGRGDHRRRRAARGGRAAVVPDAVRRLPTRPRDRPAGRPRGAYGAVAGGEPPRGLASGAGGVAAFLSNVQAHYPMTPRPSGWASTVSRGPRRRPRTFTAGRSVDRCAALHEDPVVDQKRAEHVAGRDRGMAGLTPFRDERLDGLLHGPTALDADLPVTLFGDAEAARHQLLGPLPRCFAEATQQLA